MRAHTHARITVHDQESHMIHLSHFTHDSHWTIESYCSGGIGPCCLACMLSAIRMQGLAWLRRSA